MKAVYPVFFTKTDQIILVEVPDLEILTEGKDMNDAFEMAPTSTISNGKSGFTSSLLSGWFHSKSKTT